MFNSLFKKDAQHKDNVDFVTDASVAQLMHAPKTARILLWVMLSLVAVLVLWASLTSIDEIVRGQGKAIPISHTQVVQNVEGGIVKSILVREGQHVKKGQLLMELDATEASSNLIASVAETSSLMAEEIRLSAEANDRDPDFTKERKAKHDKYVDQQLLLYNIRHQDLTRDLTDVHLKIIKAKQELISAQQQHVDLSNQHHLLQKKLQMNMPLLKMGAVSESTILDIKQSIAQIKTEKNRIANQVPSSQAEVDRLEEQSKDIILEFKAKAQEQLVEVRAKLDIAQGKTTIKQVGLEHTQLHSPVDGVIQKVYINTIGGVAKPGMELIDIIPVGDEILIEAKIKPKDVGFLRPGQKATVKITAYDYAVYGGLAGVVENVSADTIVDKKGNSFYIIKVRVAKAWFGEKKTSLPVIPGMMATVDVTVAERSVLQYIFKPLLRILKN